MLSPPAVDPAYAAETNFPMMMGVEGTLMGLALLFVALRTYARLAIVKSFGWDDAMMILTLVRRGDGSPTGQHLGLLFLFFFFSPFSFPRPVGLTS